MKSESRGQARDMGGRGFEAAPFCEVRMCRIARRVALLTISAGRISYLQVSVKGVSLHFVGPWWVVSEQASLRSVCTLQATIVDKNQSSINQPCRASPPHISELIWHLDERCSNGRRVVAGKQTCLKKASVVFPAQLRSSKHE